MKIVTLCGSMKFIREFRKMEVLLSRQGSLILSPIFVESVEISESDAELLGKHHLKK